MMTLFFALFGYGAVRAQDIITLKSGEEMQTKVLEINLTEVKYKKFENLQGPAYSIEKDKVFMIKYENGNKDVFENEL